MFCVKTRANAKMQRFHILSPPIGYVKHKELKLTQAIVMCLRSTKATLIKLRSHDSIEMKVTGTAYILDHFAQRY